MHWFSQVSNRLTQAEMTLWCEQTWQYRYDEIFYGRWRGRQAIKSAKANMFALDDIVIDGREKEIKGKRESTRKREGEKKEADEDREYSGRI